MSDIPFEATDWAGSSRRNMLVNPQGPVADQALRNHPGSHGRVLGRVHRRYWCDKGHILLCLAGDLETELADGRRFLLAPGMSYQVADNAEAHRSISRTGATLFIVD